MNLADVFIFLFSILGFVIVFISYWLMSTALFPKYVARSAERFGRMPIKVTLLGTIIGLPIIFIGFAMSGKAPNGGLKVLALVIGLLPLLLGLFGSAGLAQRIGDGLPAERDFAEPWRRTLRGSIVLALSFVLPIIGWFGVMPFAFLGGFGVFPMGVFSRRPAPVLAPPPVPAFAPSETISPPP